ncbi:MAG: hypothetical protein AAF423_00455 [Pseudomonadota bacterium]
MICVRIIGWVVLISFVFTMGAAAAEFKIVKRIAEPNGHGYLTEIAMSGPVVDGDAERLNALVEQIKANGNNIYRSLTLTLDSIGGKLEASLKLSEVVREWGLGTRIYAGKSCLSGCAIVFMAGSWWDSHNTLDINRAMSPQAVLGFDAPFEFMFDGNISPEDSIILIPEAERSGLISASKLIKLSRDRILPVSLVEELLQYEFGRFLYIDTIDRAARWKIELLDAGPIKIAHGIVPMTERGPLSAHCNNHLHWNDDVSFSRRQSTSSLDVNQLSFGGLDESCSYMPDNDTVNFEVISKHGSSFGSVLYWHTLAADTKLDTLTDELVKQDKDAPDPFENPPISQIDGPCRNGFQWIGGWSGGHFQDSIAHARYRSCETSRSPIWFECRHGSGKIDTYINLEAFGAAGTSNPRVLEQIDEGRQLSSNGKVSSDRGPGIYVSTLPRHYFTFDQLKSASRFRVSVNGHTKELHLIGSRQALEAMEASCL